MHALMTDVLGYDRYLTYGEDISANVNDLIAGTYPEHVAGTVVTHAHFPTREERSALTDPAERAFFDELDAAGGPNGGYGHIQHTRPDTLAAALNDSPAGLLAWLTEKLVEWSDTPGGEPSAVEHRISRERILTEAMIYWVTESIGSSFRPYYEGEDLAAPMPLVEVPAAVFIQRHEGSYPESIARRLLPRSARVRATRRGRPLRRRGGSGGDGRAHEGLRPQARPALRPGVSPRRTDASWPIRARGSWLIAATRRASLSRLARWHAHTTPCHSHRARGLRQPADRSPMERSASLRQRRDCGRHDRIVDRREDRHRRSAESGSARGRA